MSTVVQLPEHKLSETPNSRTIEIGEWTITARTNPISNASECDALQTALQGMPLPEMTFGNNSLELKHKPTGWTYLFSTADALKAVKNGELGEGDGSVKVGYSEAWLKSRCVILHVCINYLSFMKVAQVNHLSSQCRKPLKQSLTTGRILPPIADIIQGQIRLRLCGRARMRITRSTRFH
jgi:hypothetical protein